MIEVFEANLIWLKVPLDLVSSLLSVGIVLWIRGRSYEETFLRRAVLGVVLAKVVGCVLLYAFAPREGLGSDAQRQFGRDKSETLTEQCRRCEVRFACHGECPKSRFAVSDDGEPGQHYLCAGWYEFFTHIDHPLETMVALREAGRPASDVMAIMRTEMPDLATSASKAPRNSPCPCGSGLKTKHCHGRTRPVETSEPTTYPVFVAEPRRRVSGMEIEV